MGFLTIDNIHYTYFTKSTATAALFDISLDIEKGELISFLGPSGCGKTTLLSIIAGLLQPTEGYIELEGKMIKREQCDISYMLQQNDLLPWKTVEENILLGLTKSQKRTEKKKRYLLDLLHKMGLQDIQRQYPKQLSNGMKQKVILARTLATDPKLFMLDGPFSALDVPTKLHLEDLVFQTLKQFEKTAILVTHDIREAIVMSDRIFLFSAHPGKLHKAFIIPEELRTLLPSEAHNHESFSPLFQTIQKELEALEVLNY